ncbi:c-type cytochrome [Falsiroseomonas selenitidurans]|uniref:C-type cytochrome n=1 Tax=Falsiroseomonas selenitidurans TaxID=2716335 RepID=A0ABX1E7X6_9PROT|nr:c-type cytochrome [Falsiroseomonas selenitidurans]NKC32850.1 c-type cytochrome [Falsiroseomonas selenitidurans]
MILRAAGLTLLLLGACDAAEPPAALRIAGGDAARGAQVIAAHGCGACHVIPGIPGAVSWVGPPLIEWARRGVLAGRVPNAPEHLVAFLRNPQATSPGSAMPNLGLGEAEARDAAAYLYTLGAAQAVPAGQPLAPGEAGTLPGPRLRPQLRPGAPQ